MTQGTPTISQFRAIPKKSFPTYFSALQQCGKLLTVSGVTAVLETTGNNRSHLLDLLEKTESGPQSELMNNGSGAAAFFASLNAAQLQLSAKAILLFIDRNVVDENISHLSGPFIKNKGIRVYVVWGGVYPSVKEEYKLLKDLCEYTGGRFIVDVGVNLSDFYRRQYFEEGTEDQVVSKLYQNK